MTDSIPTSRTLAEKCAAIRGLLFDKDGTLLDYDASWTPVNRRAAHMAARGDADFAKRLLAAAGVDPETGRAAPDSVMSAGTAVDIARVWVEAGAPFDHHGLAAALDELFCAAVADMVPVTDLRALFDRFKSGGYKLGIASSDSEAAVRATARVFGVADSLDFIAGYDSGHGTKPDPAVLAAFCRATGLAPHEAAVIGDNTHDVGMGRTGGAGLTIGVLTGSGTRDSLGPLSDLCLENIGEMRHLFQTAPSEAEDR
jgi:phosphoglycolate phosphatase